MDHFKIKQQKGILSIVIILIILLTINQNSVIIKGSIYSNSQEKSFEPKKLIENPKLETNPENITVLSYKMHLKIQTNFQFKVTSTFVLRNNNTEPLNFYIIDINQNISSVFVYDPIDSLSFSWKTDESYGNRINITLRYPLLSDDMTVFYIEYELQESIYQVNQPSQYYGFDFEINHTLATNTFTLEIDLPMYGSLIESDSPAAVSPDPNRIYTEDNIVKIIW
ncbi:MAG: hypothetical protein U9O98_08150, partial [Asgard group archaeon]|nr:hypothetical protein [Asgard group archaeon]